MPPYNSSDPTASFLSSSCLDFLLIELVPLAQRVTTQLDASITHHPDAAFATNGLGNVPPPPSSTVAESATTSNRGVVAGSSASIPRRLDDEEHLDAVHYRLESQGYRVGQGLVERFANSPPRISLARRVTLAERLLVLHDTHIISSTGSPKTDRGSMIHLT